MMDTLEATKPNISRLEIGAQVYDRTSVRIGKVKHIQFPDATADLADFPYDIDKKTIPDDAVYQLLRAGFLIVDTGLLAKDRIVLLDHIARVREKEVHLNVKGENLFTI